ncbi:MAG TPA: hypothetical protein VF666_13935 [Pyrinomonadaceae bacterium]|jgi:hypothetical protein
MALGKKTKRHFRKRHSHRDYTPQEAADMLAPPEEQAATQKQGSKNGGAIVVGGTGELNLPRGFDEDEKENAKTFGLDPVIIFILGLALAFIAFIAYLISIEPPK